MLKPGGAETSGGRGAALQMLQVSHHVSSPAAVSGRRGAKGEVKEVWGGEWSLGKDQGVDTGGDETALTSAGPHLVFAVHFLSIV